MHLDFSKFDGLIPAVVQDYSSGRVLMVGYMNGEAFRRTVETGFATFYSRSRQKLWLKGETSGHRLVVKEISTDCDQDCLLVRVEPQGPGVCHNGYESCFYRRLENGRWVESDPRTYDPAAPKGVAGRNSDNTFIQQVLHWEPRTLLRTGMEHTYAWIATQFADRKAGRRVVTD